MAGRRLAPPKTVCNQATKLSTVQRSTDARRGGTGIVGAASSRDKAKAAEQPGVAAASTREATIAATSPTTAPVAAPSATNNAVANAAAVAPAPTQATAAVVAPTPAVQSVDPKAKYQQMQQIAGIRPTNTNTTPATAPAPAAVNSNNSSSNNNNNSTITAPSLGLEGAHSFGSAIGACSFRSLARSLARSRS